MPDLFYGTDGPQDAEIVAVGEAWGEYEDSAKKPFVGPSGHLLRGGDDSLFEAAGIDSRSVLFTNVVPERPPNNNMWEFFEPTKEATLPPIRGLFPRENVRRGLETLYAQISRVRPKLVIAVGNYALWATTPFTGYTSAKDHRGRTITPSIRTPNGIGNWRGSMLYYHPAFGDPTATPLLPIYHPAAIMRQWPTHNLTRFDLKVRAHKALQSPPDWRPRKSPRLLAPPTFDEALGYLEGLRRRLDGGPVVVSVDVETARNQFITCIGFADTPDLAISIPFVVPRTYDPYWGGEQEFQIRLAIRNVLSHPNCRLLGQNFLYDIQYLEYEHLGRNLVQWWDTMLAQHVLYPGTPKDLGHLASLYCRHYWYWKNDAREWDEKEDLAALLEYNCWDVLRPLEIYREQERVIEIRGLGPQWEYMKETTELALEMMHNGVAQDEKKRHELLVGDAARGIVGLMTIAEDVHHWFRTNLPQDLVNPVPAGKKWSEWWRSPIQLRNILQDMGLKVPLDRKSGQPSTGKESMKILRDRYPGLRLIWDRIQALRSLEDAIDTLNMRRDLDGRMRCGINPGGAQTFRWSTDTNAFGRGGNLQNLPKLKKRFGDDDEPTIDI